METFELGQDGAFAKSDQRSRYADFPRQADRFLFTFSAFRVCDLFGNREIIFGVEPRYGTTAPDLPGLQEEGHILLEAWAGAKVYACSTSPGEIGKDWIRVLEKGPLAPGGLARPVVRVEDPLELFPLESLLEEGDVRSLEESGGDVDFGRPRCGLGIDGVEYGEALLGQHGNHRLFEFGTDDPKVLPRVVTRYHCGVSDGSLSDSAVVIRLQYSVCGLNCAVARELPVFKC